MEVGSAETTLNGGSADPMPICIGDVQINQTNFQYSNILWICFVTDDFANFPSLLDVY